MAKQISAIPAPGKALNESILYLLQGLHGLISKEMNPTDYFNNIIYSLTSISAKPSGIKPETIDVANKLLSKLSCNLCGSKSISTHFNCQHFLCNECTQKNFREYAKLAIVPLYIECPICKTQHLEEEMYIKIPHLWPQIIESIKNTKILKGLDKLCAYCNRQKSNDEFPESPACDNHLYCKECVGQKFRQGNFICDTCEVKMKIDPTDEKGYCSSCKKEVYYVGDSLTTLCKGHTHCYNCLEGAVENCMCMTCGLSLGDNDETRAQYMIKGKCFQCFKDREKMLILVKQCCDTPVCAFCQLVDPFNCLKCKSSLNKESVSLILHVRSVINSN
ncbi:hypothetical protein SteCoe_38219 [Stentor coeruleus]|uniref:RING-type domain-containing protein n=1 Tax=Stentor coeruleus TaxID=5963 RepID=A0A1R2ALM1_9CILI|nr:hypothetical protein SteCoe_38219 [Stentor coeruleus]